MNNNDSNNEGLNTLSLGSIDSTDNNLNIPISDIPPISPEELIESLSDQLTQEEDLVEIESSNNIDIPSVVPEVKVEPINNEGLGVIDIDTTPVFNEIGTMPPLNNGESSVLPVQPVAPQVDISNYDIPQTINDFNTSPMFTDIGTVPPIPDIPINNINGNNPSPKKKGFNKVLFVLIIVLAIAAVGVGVYIFLHISNVKNTPVRTKNLELEVGSEISTNINDYATFKGIDSSTCSLDTSNVDVNVYNEEYTYKITCNNVVYTGKIKMIDTVKPEVVTNDVTIQVNGEITADLFIKSCNDFSKCTYSFKDENKVKDYLSTPESYHVDIIVTDEAGNETEVTGTLIVTETIASVFLICSKVYDDYTEVTKLGLVENEFNKLAIRNYNFIFDTQTAYNSYKAQNINESQITYNNITGSPTFDDINKTLSLSKYMSYKDLNTEMGSTLPTSIGELKTFYENKNYNCKIGL